MSEPKYGLMVLSCPSGASVRLVQSTVVVLYWKFFCWTFGPVLWSFSCGKYTSLCVGVLCADPELHYTAPVSVPRNFWACEVNNHNDCCKEALLNVYYRKSAALVLILSIEATCVVKGWLDLVPSFWTLWCVYQLPQPVSKSTSIDTNVMMKNRQCSSLTTGQNVSGVHGLPLKTAPNLPFCSLKVR